MTASSNPEAAMSDDIVEDLASDIRDILASTDLDSLPHITALRQRIESKLQLAREIAAEKSRFAAQRAREAAFTANAYAHDHPFQMGVVGAVIGLLVGMAVSGIFAQRLPGEPTTRAPLTRRTRR